MYSADPARLKKLRWRGALTIGHMDRTNCAGGLSTIRRPGNVFDMVWTYFDREQRERGVKSK